jgi:hypothetical protein
VMTDVPGSVSKIATGIARSLTGAPCKMQQFTHNKSQHLACNSNRPHFKISSPVLTFCQKWVQNKTSCIFARLSCE